ncbi:hypothetical protein PT974_07716 [Cladobotryum mycophilum]|uniref:Uncharacterized protein n=1 Tax=Cladobotryum mycophilum TaxID=491253 RepID=A0ABR0SHR4_9HYPO
MVFLPPNSNSTIVTAYLLAPLSDGELKAVKAAFELGGHLRFAPMVEIKIVRPPDDYLGKSHAYIRTKEDEADRPEPFVIIDERAVSEEAVWYVKWFADQEEVDDATVESTSVLWEILVKTDEFSFMWVNYDIGNMSIGEDLGNCGVDYPVKEGFVQPKVFALYTDMREEQYHVPAWVTAAPGIARFKPGVAEAAGLITDGGWGYPNEAEWIWKPDGSRVKAPEGCVVLQVKWNPDFPWPEYRWPRGSL